MGAAPRDVFGSAGHSAGIIGSNGAGKSTLLKILARVTRPTEGRVVGRGRLVSLLELGAGFNRDFSAHDNILMNAAMHGISKREALERMPEIIEFAELQDFTDNPVRQYSSGMYLRLAFSVAINMQPDILLADEILAGWGYGLPGAVPGARSAGSRARSDRLVRVPRHVCSRTSLSPDYLVGEGRDSGRRRARDSGRRV